MKASSLLAAAGASTALTFFFLAAAPGTGSPAAAATAPPTPPPISNPATPGPPPINTPATPGPAASVIGLPGATPAPAASGKSRPSPPPARKGVDGVWEVEIQHANSTDYTHFAIRQQGDAISGTYLDSKGKKYPVAGSIDGQSIRLIVTMPNGTTLLLEGKLDGTTDMIGMLTSPDGQVPFTAAYRAKQNWIENVNPSPGGISAPGGGYTPP